MSPAQNVHGTSVASVLSPVLHSDSELVYVVDPTAAVVRSVVEQGIEVDTPPTLRVLSDDSLLKDVLDDFPVATDAADLVEAGTLELRVTDRCVENTLVVTETEVVAVVRAGDHVAGLTTDDDAFVERARAVYGDHFDSADPFSLRTPAISALRESLTTDFGADVRADFDGVLDSLRARPEAAAALDEVMLSLLVAAKNELLLYDISKWGEDVGLASKATFSRTKTDLEAAGVVETEKVPIDVGRPRLRLCLGDERLREADVEDLAAVTGEILD